MSFFTRIRDDVRSIVRRDPAARSAWEVAVLYPGVHAIVAHRASHWMWRHGAKFPARALSQVSRFATGVEIHPAAEIGDRLFIDHGAGVVIGETAVVGDDVTLFHGVTLGGMSTVAEKRHPTVGDGVTIGTGAKVLGPIGVGNGSRIGANAVLLRSVPPESVVVGVPGQVIASRGHRIAAADQIAVTDKPSTDHSTSDPVGTALQALIARVDELERNGQAAPKDLAALEGREPKTYEVGVWDSEDFSI
ncbi:MAG: serine O-acetyltransferase [Candidatus Nanopelagicales bacterium]